MTFRPPSPSAQSSIASGTEKSSSVRSSSRSQHSVWGAPSSHSGQRRGLTPLSTTNISSSTAPPLSSPFSGILNSSIRSTRKPPSPATTPSAFNFQHPGSQPLSHTAHSLSSPPKSRAITPSAGTHLANSANNALGGGGSGGGGGLGSSRGVNFSPLLSGVNSPTGFASDKPGSAVSSSQSSLTKISIAQVFLLLDSITEKEGKEKWEVKAAQIYKVSHNIHFFSP
jgi:CCR4-NOT transcription complex subunit 1